ncbi:MAG: Mur ligase family protein, partial [Gemmatimonadota bacterium]|nr:Mur ligase family protein [Gemmatimonadota bacterium]
MTAFPVTRVVQALEAAGLLVATRGTLPDSASDIADDSRAASPGAIFVAVRGLERDGHDYLQHAAERGAAAAIVEDAERTELPRLVVGDGRRAAAVAAAAAFDAPARALRILSVTGTNGKTTTVGIVRHLLDRADAPSASIGTLGILLGSAGRPVEGGGGLTTPGAVGLQRAFRGLVDAGVRTVAMEVSSHSLDQRRVDGVAFDVVVFTNLTRDHLDYHGTMGAYFAAKAGLIEHIKPDGVAVVNADDPAWQRLPAIRRGVAFGIRSANADVRAERVRFSPGGSQ